MPTSQRPVESGAASLKGQKLFGRDIVDLKSFTTSDEKQIKVNAQSITVELQASDEASLLSKNKVESSVSQHTCLSGPRLKNLRQEARRQRVSKSRESSGNRQGHSECARCKH